MKKHNNIGTINKMYKKNLHLFFKLIFLQTPRKMSGDAHESQYASFDFFYLCKI